MRRGVRFWHDVVLEAGLRDYSRTAMDPEQPVVTYASRAAAMAHLAIYDAYVGVTGGATYYSYASALPKLPPGEQAGAAMHAVAAAASNVLRPLYTKQNAYLLGRLALFTMVREYRAGSSAASLAAGSAFGRAVAQRVNSDRAGDGSAAGPAFVDAVGPFAAYEHRPDPTATPRQMVHAPHWGSVRPFGFRDLASSVSALPDPLDGGYVAAFTEVAALGSAAADTTRSAAETDIGVWWAYDGAFRVGTPHRIYSLVTDAALDAWTAAGGAGAPATGAALARFFAAVHVAMADATIQAWREKYDWNLWRPVVGVRLADEDDYPETVANPTWTPLGSPRTNTPQSSVTPSFPAYPSGHAAVGTAGLAAAQLLLGLPASFAFDAESEELNGRSTDQDGKVRPRVVKRYTMDDAIADNEASRIYLGVHWDMDCVQGKALGHEVADAVVAAFPALA